MHPSAKRFHHCAFFPHLDTDIMICTEDKRFRWEGNCGHPNLLPIIPSDGTRVKHIPLPSIENTISHRHKYSYRPSTT